MKRQKPLATEGKLEIHRAKFHPFETVKYLDIAALRKTAIARIEVGRVEGGGKDATIVAEIHKGMITRLAPIGCKGCSEGKGAAARKGGAASKKKLRAALTRVRELGLSGVKLPIPVRKAPDLGIQIGPIIIYGDPFDICIVVEEPNGDTCVVCLFGPGICVGKVIVQ